MVRMRPAQDGLPRDWSGRRMVRFARFMHRPGPILGGPAVRAAFGRNLSRPVALHSDACRASASQAKGRN